MTHRVITPERESVMKVYQQPLRLAAGLTLALSCVTGHALADGFSSQHLNPAANQSTNAYSVHAAETLGPNQWHVGVLFNYADDPLRVGDGNDWRLYGVTTGQLTSDFHAALGITKGFELGVVIPVIWLHNGDNVTALGVDNSSVGIGAGDIRLAPKYTIFDRASGREAGSALAITADIYFPSGDADTYRGGEFRGEPRLIWHHDFKKDVRLAANLGWRFRPEHTIGDIEVDDTLTWGVMVDTRVPNLEAMRFFGEIFGEASVLADDFDKQESPVEVLLGMRYELPNGVAFTAGGGTGIIRGFSAPDWRVLAGVSVTRTAKSMPKDSDGDGISDQYDNCPDHPNMDQADSDGDGVGDACTFDSDGDGIPDHRDACPNEAEDYDGFEDEDGCPEDGTGVVSLTCDQIVITQRIEFEFDSSTLLDSSKEVLDQVAAVLRSASNVRKLRIEGHADQVGDPDYNRTLSQRRADAVRDYLVGRRVSRSRLQAVGVGADNPLSTEQTEEDQALNRRVEFHVVEQDNRDCQD